MDGNKRKGDELTPRRSKRLAGNKTTTPTPNNQLGFEFLMEQQDYTAASREAERTLEALPVMARAALTQGRAIVHAAVMNMVKNGNAPAPGVLEKARSAFKLSQKLNPTCQDTKGELSSLLGLMNELSAPDPDEEASVVETELPDSVDVLVVGAGCAGVGIAFMLTKNFGLDASRVLLVEKGEAVGESFRKWPKEMRFISPSFNSQGWTKSFDLNSVAYGTSPAYSIHTEHPSGKEYADYLAGLATNAKLRVHTRTEATSVQAVGTKAKPLFKAELRSGCDSKSITKTVTARYVVWAAGEFSYPRDGLGSSDSAFTGAELCLHNSRVKSWGDLPGEDLVVIGGYESGIDACVNLAGAGKKCTVVASTSYWKVQTTDPSTELAPYTAARLREVTSPEFSPRPRLLAPLRVVRVEKAAGGGFDVTATWKAAEKLDEHDHGSSLRERIPEAGLTAGAEGSELVLHTDHPPLLCTGFEGSVASSAKHLFTLADEKDAAAKDGCLQGMPMLTSDDESRKTPGVFLVGPTVSHGQLSFCYVYKFHQRFGIVANAICRGLKLSGTEYAVEQCREKDMYLDDFSCCDDHCGHAC